MIFNISTPLDDTITTEKIANGAVTANKLNSNVTTFFGASTRTNIASGDSITTIWGKIAKWFTDLKDGAFRSVANNLTTASAGSAVLDAYQGKVLGDQLYHSYNDTVTLTPASGVSFARNRSFRIGDFILLNYAITVSSQIASNGTVFTIPNLHLDASCDIVMSTASSGGSAILYLRASDSNAIANGVLPAGTYFCNALVYAPKA